MYGARLVKPKMINVWLKKIMKMEGIDTHDSRHIFSVPHQAPKQAMAGVPIENIKLHANLSLNNSRFEDYYYKPEDHHIKGATIMNTSFGNVTKKIATSEVD
ncbi:hypothetical protein BCV72DRAFT_318371 [Rhizopus microsporus var. microsporus]|uniref:Uncharacterized protein n=1 Tax=Rhizopus microsporus var. microsporus TaxID=86635 RepID=A0A1X0RCS9_RHIZD|nr:hypothetical protein BCV72DRAFT_318371 [Rhizopus microsporus var. microsporus]